MRWPIHCTDMSELVRTCPFIRSMAWRTYNHHHLTFVLFVFPYHSLCHSRTFHSDLFILLTYLFQKNNKKLFVFGDSIHSSETWETEYLLVSLKWNLLFLVHFQSPIWSCKFCHWKKEKEKKIIINQITLIVIGQIKKKIHAMASIFEKKTDVTHALWRKHRLKCLKKKWITLILLARLSTWCFSENHS
jgi:hypothetical protein